MQPLLSSEDMEVQERAHNATALLRIVLRKINPTDPALGSDVIHNDVTDTLVEHEPEQRLDIWTLRAYVCVHCACTRARLYVCNQLYVYVMLSVCVCARECAHLCFYECILLQILYYFCIEDI